MAGRVASSRASARRSAHPLGTSVSAKVREYLVAYAQGEDNQQAAAQAFIAAARRSQANRDSATGGGA